MDCRESQALLTAFHDGELPDADRARMENHLRGCPECGALLGDLARVDAAARVPDPGPGYWDRFNARVMDRIGRETEGTKATVLRPNHGWVRQQLRYLVPAVAAAAMVVVVVRYGGLDSGVRTPSVPPAVREPEVPDPAGQRDATTETESDGRGWPGAGAGRDATGSVAPAPAMKKREPAVVARRVPEVPGRAAEGPSAPPPVIADERLAAAPRGEIDRPPDRPRSEVKEKTSRDRAAAPAGIDIPSPAAEPPFAAKAESASGMRMAKDRAAEARSAESLGKTRSPCDLARTLAARKRWREAETAQRACLAQDRSATAQEKGLVFLAELLDRQERFAEADDVITGVGRQFPQSRPLDLYRQQRPMVQKEPMAAPVTR